MNNLVKKHLDVLEKYIPGKPIAQVQREYGLERVVKLASNESPYPPFDEAIEAMEAVCEQLNRYPDEEVSALRAALSTKLGVSTKNILIGNGSNELIRTMMEAVLAPGDEVVYGSPTFMLYRMTALKYAAKVVEVPLRNFTYDLEAMAEALNKKTKMVIICNPNNPTGTIVKKEEFERFIEIADKYNCLVLVDQAYQEFVDDSSYPNPIKHVKEGRPVVVTGTFSKIYGLAGLRIGYGAAPCELVDIDRKLRDPFNINTLAQAAALESLSCDDQLKERYELNKKNKKYLYLELEKIGVEFVPSQANFVLINLKKDSTKVFKELLAKGIITRTGDIFGKDLQNYLRITVGTKEELEIFIEALSEIFNY